MATHQMMMGGRLLFCLTVEGAVRYGRVAKVFEPKTHRSELGEFLSQTE